MNRFTQLYIALDGTTKTNAKVDALVAYFEQATAEDAAWAVYFDGPQTATSSAIETSAAMGTRTGQHRRMAFR